MVMVQGHMMTVDGLKVKMKLKKTYISKLPAKKNSLSPKIVVKVVCTASNEGFLRRLWKKVSPCSCLKLCQMLTDFQNSFTDRLSSKFLIKQ